MSNDNERFTRGPNTTTHVVGPFEVAGYTGEIVVIGTAEQTWTLDARDALELCKALADATLDAVPALRDAGSAS